MVSRLRPTRSRHRAHQEDGELFGSDEITTNPVSLPLEAGQVLRLDISDTFGFVGDQLRDGWLEVAATTQVLHGALSYTVPASKSLAAVATSAQGSRQAAFSHLATDLGFFTGVALLDSAALAADVRIVAIAADGQILGTATRTLAPGQRISQLLGVELIPPGCRSSGGSGLCPQLGLGTGDAISLDGNLLDAADCGNINALVARGVAVDIAAALCP